MQSNIIKIRSGGQTGADRAALDFAIAHDIPYGGWVPKGGWAEDMPEPPGLCEHYPMLKEVGTSTINERTMRNVMDADATLIIRLQNSPGTNLTVETAIDEGKNYFICDGDVKELKQWFDSLPPGTELNVGGPRESEVPGTYDETYKLLCHCFGVDKDEHPIKKSKKERLEEKRLSKETHLTMSTYTDKQSVAEDIARQAMEQNVAISAHISKVSSMYRWGGEIEYAPEWQVTFYLKGSKSEQLLYLIKRLHNYREPPITF